MNILVYNSSIVVIYSQILNFIQVPPIFDVYSLTFLEYRNRLSLSNKSILSDTLDQKGYRE